MTRAPSRAAAEAGARRTAVWIELRRRLPEIAKIVPETGGGDVIPSQPSCPSVRGAASMSRRARARALASLVHLEQVERPVVRAGEDSAEQ